MRDDETRRWLRALPLPLLAAAAVFGAGWLARQDARAVSVALLGAGIALVGVWAGAEISRPSGRPSDPVGDDDSEVG